MDVKDVKFDATERRLDIYISRIKKSKVQCPVYGKEYMAHDSKSCT